MTDEQLPEEPKSWVDNIAAVVLELGLDDDVRDLNGMVTGVHLGRPEVDLNERVFSSAYDVPPPAVERGV